MNFPENQTEKWRVKRSIHLSLGRKETLAFVKKPGPLDTRVQ